MLRGQHDYQRRDHAIDFLAITMWQKKTSLFIQQHFVELGREFLFFLSQPLCELRVFENCVNTFLPRGTGQFKTRRIQFPDFSDFRIDDGFGPFAIAIESLTTNFNKFLSRRLGKRRSDYPQAIDFQARQNKRG